MMTKYRKYQKYFIVSVITIVAMSHLLIACAPVRPAVPANYASQDICVHDRLSDTAIAVEKSLRILAAAQEPNVMNAINTAPLVTVRGGMGCKATLDWSGPIEPLLHEIARLTDYQVKILGNTPPIPVIVSINVENRVIADIVKDAGLQAGKRANLVVYPSSKIIELRYATV